MICLGPAKEDAAMNDGSDITAVIKFVPEYIRVRESLEERRRERTRCKIVLKFDLGKYYSSTMVLGQILAKMTRREISIFIIFSDTYTCPYVMLKV